MPTVTQAAALTEAVSPANQLASPAAVAGTAPFRQDIHIFRAVAITLVVATHSIPSLDWSARPLTGKIVDTICNETSILFVFIAGYLFQHLLPKYQLIRYYRSKLTNVIIPYAIVSIPALIVFTGLVQRTAVWEGFYLEPVPKQVFYFLITGKHLAPLWFIPTIALFYVAAPILVWGDRKGHLYYFLPPLIVLSAYLGRDGPYGPLNKAVYLVPSYVFGMMLSHYREQSMGLARRYWWVLAALAVTSFLWNVLDAPMPPYPQILQKLSLSPLLVLAFERAAHRIGNTLDYVGHTSMSIFLIHAYLISCLKIATTYIMTGRIYDGVEAGLIPGSVFTLLLYATAVTLLCLATIRLGQKVLGRYSRFVIGA